jgi:division protein CdvB (Snf7/Vps24/ESCRT-III family)
MWRVQLRYTKNILQMKKILRKFDRFKFGHKLHQLQKRYKRARLNGYTEKMDEYKRRMDELKDKLKNIK